MKSHNIREKHRDTLIESEEIGNRWKQCIEELYQGSRPLEKNLKKDDCETDDKNRSP
jgi:hypothetical protein